ncbi:unnamed protein product [Closterium sp. Naga37s-1]|nr:unnamed protein product [Closterium sp. Naga37s-1]
MTDATVAAGVTAIVDPLLRAIALAPVDPAHYPLLHLATRAISAAAARRPSRRAVARHLIPATRTHSAARRQVPARPPVDFATAVKGVAGVARVVGVAGEAAATPLHSPDRPPPFCPRSRPPPTDNCHPTPISDPVLPCSARAAPFCPFVPYPCYPYPLVPHQCCQFSLAPHSVCAARSRAARHPRAARPYST